MGQGSHGRAGLASFRHPGPGALTDSGRLIRSASGVAAMLGCLVSIGAMADPLPPADNASIVTLQDENASISASSLTDRYYVNGLRASYTSPTDLTPAWMQAFGDELWGSGRQRFAFDVEQSIFTPADTNAAVPPPNDRPYAGLLEISGSLIQDTLNTRNVIELTAGWTGPATGAEQLQNGFHDVISQSHDAGWDTQLRNEGFGQILAARTWRLPLIPLVGLETDVLPALTAAAGNLRTYAQAGVVVRFGQGLRSDFGVPRIQPGIDGTDAYTPMRPFAWYVFAGGDGQAVANDITFDREDAPYATSVAMIHDVGEFEGGAAAIWHGVRVSYTQVFQSHEFVSQRGGLHEFGSLAASVRF